MGFIREETQLLMPRGEVFFDLELPEGGYAGEFPMGNCPEASVSISADKADHFDSRTGIAQKDRTVPVKVERSGKLTCDNFSAENYARYLSGSLTRLQQAAAPVTDELVTVSPGYFYQLGQTLENPVGVRDVSGLTVKSEDGVTTYLLGRDYEADPKLGRIQIKVGGTIEAKTKIKLGYTPVEGVYELIKSGGVSELKGRMRIVPDNAVGKNRDMYFPSVVLTPEGDLPIIAEGSSTDFAQMEFGLEVLKPANGEAVYVAGRPVPGVL